MASKALKRLATKLARALPLNLLPLDFALRFLQQLAVRVSGLVFLRDWRLQASGRPQFFKHELNLVRWISDPALWAFVARGVYAREGMFKGCKVLDLCCGDGSCSYLFFADIAGHIDAVDNDLSALKYARRYHRRDCISYHHLDLTAQPLPSTGYDFAVWNAAICYFTRDEIELILDKIVAAGTPGLLLSGMLPKANGWIDHKTEFADLASVRGLFETRFKSVSVRQIEEADAVTFYFSASQSTSASPSSLHR